MMRNRSIQQKNENTDIGINQLKKEKSHPMDDSKRNQLFISMDMMFYSNHDMNPYSPLIATPSPQVPRL